MASLSFPPAFSPRLRGQILVASAALCFSLAGVLVRLAQADAWTVAFWRSGFMAGALLAYLAILHRRGLVARFFAIGRFGLLISGGLTTAFLCFILALSRTTVADTVVITGAAPLFVAAIAWVALGEKVGVPLLVRLVTALAGIALMVVDSVGRGGLWGDVLALGVAVAMALNTVWMRRARGLDLLPAVALAGVVSAAAAWPMASPLAVSGGSLAVLALLGVVQLGLGLVLYTRGVRLLPAADASLLAELETVLSPLWAWLAVGEMPAPLALWGGAVVLGVLIHHAVSGDASPNAAEAAE